MAYAIYDAGILGDNTDGHKYIMAMAISILYYIGHGQKYIILHWPWPRYKSQSDMVLAMADLMANILHDLDIHISVITRISISAS